MRNRISAFATAFVVAILMFGCTADQVAPKSDSNNNVIETGPLGDSGPHYSMSPICSYLDTLDLASATGSFTVNGGSTPWGTMEICNGMDDSNVSTLQTKFSLAYNWYIGEITYYFGNTSLIQIGPNGVPIINGSWETKAVNPVLNDATFHTSLNGMPSENTLVARIQVGQMDWQAFDGSLDPSTLQYLWVWNDQFAVSGSPRQSASPLYMPWETVACPAVVSRNTTSLSF